MIIFVQNYEKIVDSGIISIIVAVAISGLVSLLDKKKKETDQAEARRSASARRARTPYNNPWTAAAESPSATESNEPRTEVRRNADSIEPAAEPVFDAPLEGARVTADPEMATERPRAARPGVPPLPGGNLRSAIIWSEILKPKF